MLSQAAISQKKKKNYIFLNAIYSCDAKLNFHVILQKYF